MNPQLIKRMAREAGMVEGPWANGNNERIWQENRDFPDALEMFASLVIQEFINAMMKEIDNQAKHGVIILENTPAMNQAISTVKENFGLDTLPESV